MENILTKICIVCGKKFTKPKFCGLPEWKKKRKFCSRECSDKWKIGKHFSPKTEFSKERHYIPSTTFKKGQRSSPKTEFKKGHTPWNKGKHWSLKDRYKFSRWKGIYGEKAPNWKGGITKDPDYWAVAKAKRKTMILKNGGSHTLQEWNDLKRKYNYTCAICGKKEPEIHLTQDHIIPLSKGGSNDIENIQPLCKRCNSIKNAKIL